MISPLAFYRVGRYARPRRIPFIPWLMHRLCLLFCSADIPMSCSIGRNGQFAQFGIGTVISDQAVIGDNVIIYHGVTIGRSRGIHDTVAHTVKGIVIGDNTLIGAHAVLLAKTPLMRIGKDCEAGAGAVVITDVPDNCIAVGNPARVMPRRAPM